MIGNGPLRKDIVTTTRNWIGTPYMHQASTKMVGADCLGLVRGVWRELYGDEPASIPPYSPTWFQDGNGEKLLEAAQQYLQEKQSVFEPADVLVFRMVRRGPAKHMGIVTEQNRFVHAYAGREVAENWLSDFWLARVAGIFSFPGVSS